MNGILSIVSLVLAMAALARSAFERQAPGGNPVFELIRVRFPRPARPVETIIVGVVAGAAIVIGPLAFGLSRGWIHPVPAEGLTVAFIALAVVTLLVKFFSAATEELVYRGAVLPQLARYAGPLPALIGSAVLFSLSHLERTGPRTPNLLTLADLALDGIGFSIAMLMTRSLWMPSIWHAAKNVSIWLLFSRSTMQLTHGISRFEYTGPMFWIGGEVQAGVVDLVVTFAVIVVVIALGWRRIASGLEWIRSA